MRSLAVTVKAFFLLAGAPSEIQIAAQFGDPDLDRQKDWDLLQASNANESRSISGEIPGTLAIGDGERGGRSWT